MSIPTISVRTSSGLVEAVPYLLGFAPSESLVLIVLDGGKVGVTARMDASDALRALAPVVAKILGRFPGCEFIALAYMPEQSAAEEILDQANEIVRTKADYTVLPDGSWTRRDTGESGVLDAEGPTAAEMIYHGLQRRASRDEVAALLAPPKNPSPIPAFAPDDVADWLATRLTDLSFAGEMDNLLLAAAAAAAETNQALIRHLEYGEVAATMRSALLSSYQVTGSTDMLPLIGLTSWLSGDGAMAAMVLEMTEDHPSPILGALDWVIAEAMPPSEWPLVRPILWAVAG